MADIKQVKIDSITYNIDADKLDGKQASDFVLAVNGKGLSTNDYTTTEKTKLSGIAQGAEVNQNAFSNITIGSINTATTTTISADSKTDTLTLVAGNNITITPDATNDKITITASSSGVEWDLF